MELNRFEGTPAVGGPPAPVFELRNVSAFREGTLVFQGLDLSIPAGRNTAILGPNGSGKSTLLRLLSREIYPVDSPESRVRIFGRSRWNVEELRSHLGIVSSELQDAYGRGAAGRDVILSGFYSSIDTWPHQAYGQAEFDRAAEVMRNLGIESLADRPFGRMSTGQQRRFLLGRALVHRPVTLLFDEPTSGLDLSAAFHYLATMRSLMQAGTQLVLVTHHIHEIPPEISWVVFIRDGRIVAEGEKERMLTSTAVSGLFGCPVEVIESGGWRQVVPADS